MSKFTDRILAEALFRREPETKIKKVKTEMTLKDFIKMQREIEEYNEWRKSKEKKEDKKPESWWSKASVLQKLTVLTLTVPIAVILETMVIFKFGVLIAQMAPK